MDDETIPSTHMTGSQASSIDIAGHPPPNYHQWTNERLIDCYRRNSILLREYGPDERTIRVLCAVEEHLRARTIDPDRIIEEVEEADP